MRNLLERLGMALRREPFEERLRRRALFLSPSELEREIAGAVEARAKKELLRPSHIAPFYGSICALDMIVLALERASRGDKRLKMRLLRASVILDILSSLKQRLYSEGLDKYVATLDSLIEPGSVVLVHGYGDLIVSALLGVKYKVGRVWSLEVEPLGIGRRVAHYLKGEGVEAGYATSLAKDGLVRASDLVLVRMYSSAHDGLVVSDPGVYGLKRLAQIRGKPVYVFSEDLGLLGCASRNAIEEFRIKASNKAPALELPAFEVVEYAGFSGLIYEGGLVKAGIHEVLPLYENRVRAIIDEVVAKNWLSRG